jgi:hypothetical protein
VAFKVSMRLTVERKDASGPQEAVFIDRVGVFVGTRTQLETKLCPKEGYCG